MKFEIEISEAEILQAIREHVRTKVLDMLHSQIRNYTATGVIGDEVNRHWRGALPAIVAEVLAGDDALREEVIAARKRQIDREIARLLKAQQKADSRG